MSKSLIAYFSTTLGRENDSVASLFNEDGSLVDNAIEQLKTWDKERVEKLREKDKNTFDNGYKKAQSEITKRVERQLKEAFDYDGDETGEELFDKITEHAKTTAASNGKPITDDDVKKHPAFIALEKQAKKDLQAAKDEAEKALTDYKGEVTKKEKFATVAEKAIALIKAKKPILPSDETKASTRLKRDVLDPLTDYNYEIAANGDIVVLDKEGKRVEDAHGNAVKFDDFVVNIASQGIDFQEHDDKGTPHGTKPPGGDDKGDKKPFVMPTFKTKAEWDAYVSNKEIPHEHRIEVSRTAPPEK
jgi:hypothetical protein